MRFNEGTVMNYPFMDKPNTACIICRHVLEEHKKITYISHDVDDGMWQFLCNCNHSDEDARVVSLFSVFKLDESVGQVVDMPCGCYIERKEDNDNWK